MAIPRVRLRLLVGLLLVFALVASACGDDDDDTSAGGDDAAEEPTEEPSDDGDVEPTEEPTEEPSDDGGAEPTTEPSDDGGSEPVELPEISIGFLQISGAAPTGRLAEEAVRDAAEVAGWSVDSCDAQGDAVKMAECMNTLVLARPDAVIMVGVEPAAVREGLDTAAEADIPVIVIGGLVTEDPAITAMFVPDEVRLSTVLAEHVAGEFAEADSFEVGELTMDALTSIKVRREAWEAGVADLGGSVVADAAIDLANPFQASTDSTIAMLRSDPEIDIMWAGPAFSLPAISEALRQANREEVYVVGYYLEDSTVPVLETGETDALAHTDIRYFGWLAVDQLVNHFGTGEPIDPAAMGPIDPEYVVVTQDNLGEVLAIQEAPPAVGAAFATEWAEQYSNLDAP